MYFLQTNPVNFNVFALKLLLNQLLTDSRKKTGNEAEIHIDFGDIICIINCLEAHGIIPVQVERMKKMAPNFVNQPLYYDAESIINQINDCILIRRTNASVSTEIYLWEEELPIIIKALEDSEIMLIQKNIITPIAQNHYAVLKQLEEDNQKDN